MENKTFIRKAKHIGRTPILTDRIRRIEGSFCFIPHRFLRDGFLASLKKDELVLYVLLVLAADRHGMSFYGVDALCSLLGLQLDDYIVARNGLIAKDLIAFDGTRFQVLSLPLRPEFEASNALISDEDFEAHDPATIRRLIRDALGMPPENNSLKK